ncbi:hypothetical protein CEQ90_06660 [Lewinellaceae bacterium SD302]|nr:hypothetical protein CEQ90_06660 [Lewinellaceae bacterium SD302]
MRYVITSETVVKVAFALLAAMLLCNLNGVVFLILGVTAPLSPIILFLAGLIIAVSLFRLKIEISSLSMNLFLLFIVVYIVFGLLVLSFDASELHPTTSIYSTIRYYIPSLLILAASYFATRVYLRAGESRRLLRLLIGLCIFTAGFTILAPELGLTEYYTYARASSLKSERQSGLFANPNEAGAFGVYLLVLLLAGWGYFKRKAWVCLIFIPVAVYSTFISFSRASIIFTVFIILLYVLYHVKIFFAFKSVHPFRAALSSLALVAATIFVVSNFFSYVNQLSYAQRTRLLQVAKLASGEVNEKTTSERSVLYTYAFEKIGQRPLTGYGLGTYHRINFRGTYNDIGVHNTHLLILGEAGVFVYLLFFASFAILAWKGWVHPHQAIGFLILGVVAIFFINVAGAGHNALNNRTSNVLIGVACALAQYRPKSFN